MAAEAPGAQQAPANVGHFDPQGKPPSTFTLELRDGLKAELPFADKRDFDEAEEGLHRRAAVQADHGRRRQRRLGHGQLPVAALRPGLPEHPSRRCSARPC
ncbi:MAG: hypothetical protein MZW92_59180 [Comamonadaceae bacterium]|nr:hypothetical protein [Comamonadaceae bacterium]